MISEDLLNLLSATAPAPTRLYRTGVRGLDSILGDGLPCGQTMEWFGAESCGKTGALREMVRSARARGVAVAWIDAAHELMATDWFESLPGRFWVLRPLAREDAVFCAEVVLRTQSFGLVVLDGLPRLRGNRGVRLQRLARQSGSSLIILRGSTSVGMEGRLYGRVRFKAEVVHGADALERRGSFTWSMQVVSERTSSPPRTQLVHLMERVDSERMLTKLAADRPAGRTAVGVRYGR